MRPEIEAYLVKKYLVKKYLVIANKNKSPR